MDGQGWTEAAILSAYRMGQGDKAVPPHPLPAPCDEPVTPQDLERWLREALDLAGEALRNVWKSEIDVARQDEMEARIAVLEEKVAKLSPSDQSETGRSG